jgi:two-component system, sensor histidine kinase
MTLGDPVLKRNEILIEKLRESRFFEIMKDEFIEKTVAPITELKNYKEGDTLLKQGTLNKKLFFILNGAVDVYTDDQFILTLKRCGDICGEMSVISNRPCAGTVVVKEDSEIMELDITKLDKEKDEVLLMFYKLFSVIMTDKLALTSHKAKKFEAEKAKADQFAKDKRVYLGKVSHWVRNPLNFVAGSAKLLAETQLESEQKSYVDMIITGGDQILGVVDGLGKLTELEKGDLSVERKAFTLDGLIEKVIKLFEKSKLIKGLKFNFDIEEGTPNILLGDPRLLLRILVALVDNAMRFTEKGEVGLSIKALNKKDEIPTFVFTISDTGIGIPSDKIDQIYDLFFQVEDGLVSKYGGTGIGLAITKRIIELINGEISVQSTQGKGSSFTVTLPIELAMNQVIKEEPTLFNSGDWSEIVNVLVADDHENNQILMSKILSRKGFKVSCVSNGQEAVNIFRDGDFDLIFMDVQMPIMNGLEATRAIRKIEEKNNSDHTPIIAVTAGAFDSDRIACEKSGMDEYTTKPLKREELETIIERVMNLS